MDLISKQITSDSPNNTKEAVLVALNLQGSNLTVGLSFAYKDANGMPLLPGIRSSASTSIRISGLSVPDEASDELKAKAAADQIIYNRLLEAIRPIITELMDTNTAPA